MVHTATQIAQYLQRTGKGTEGKIWPETGISVIFLACSSPLKMSARKARFTF